MTDNTLSRAQLPRMFALDWGMVQRHIYRLLGNHERYRPSEWLDVVRRWKRGELRHGGRWAAPRMKRSTEPLVAAPQLGEDTAVILSDSQALPPKKTIFNKHHKGAVTNTEQSLWNLQRCIERFDERPAHGLVVCPATWEMKI